MKTIHSELVLASYNSHTGDILFTFVWTFPRIILAEINTHRMFSRNTASSRAIPTKKQRANIWQTPFIPTNIGANAKGMQAAEELSGLKRKAAEWVWRAARVPNLVAAWSLEKLGAHKQIANRLLEPWMWCQQVVSATDWNNFITLRDHWMAEPHFQELANQTHSTIDFVRHSFKYDVWQGYKRLQSLSTGEWHLPFIDQQDRDDVENNIFKLKQISAARCARVSYYLPENGKRSDYAKDIALHDRLVVRKAGNDDPIHASPIEHQATPLLQSTYCGNFRGWKQYRKEMINESGENNVEVESKANQSTG